MYDPVILQGLRNLPEVDKPEPRPTYVADLAGHFDQSDPFNYTIDDIIVAGI